ncbi:hypothetical protein PIB30_058061 [Stylosanthes scabra]|uniref:Uncharacterized protein n=1 Tax=Stylosanthes scabra TaxID=79078 RepID=A0ABU6ZIL7_9FABA|nr:hypothetical protein [Stylosanthes scabra]
MEQHHHQGNRSGLDLQDPRRGKGKPASSKNASSRKVQQKDQEMRPRGGRLSATTSRHRRKKRSPRKARSKLGRPLPGDQSTRKGRLQARNHRWWPSPKNLAHI